MGLLGLRAESVCLSGSFHALTIFWVMSGMLVRDVVACMPLTWRKRVAQDLARFFVLWPGGI